MVSLWDSQNGALLSSLQGHTNFVLGLAFSPDGARLASSGWDGKAYVWDITTGEAITTFNAKTPTAMLVGIAFSPDGKSVFTGA